MRPTSVRAATESCTSERPGGVSGGIMPRPRGRRPTARAPTATPPRPAGVSRNYPGHLGLASAPTEGHGGGLGWVNPPSPPRFASGRRLGHPRGPGGGRLPHLEPVQPLVEPPAGEQRAVVPA